MLQMVRGLFAALITLAACSCSHFNLMGLFLPTGDDVDSRFIQSTKINENAGIINRNRNNSASCTDNKRITLKISEIREIAI